jgi:glycosyltransferase involved in cell wall biosynthesis
VGDAEERPRTGARKVSWNAQYGLSRTEVVHVNPSVVYWNNIPAPYMVDRFNALAKRDNLEFQAWFSARTESDRSWEVDESTWAFRFEYLPRVRFGTRPVALPVRVFARAIPDVLVGLHAEPAFLISQEMARLRRVRTVVWLTPTHDSWVTRRRWKETIKHAMLPRVDAVFTTGSDGARIAEGYGVRNERIRILHHHIDCRQLILDLERVAPVRETIRTELGVRGLTFLYVGRLWRGKGLDYLLDAFATFAQRTRSEATLVLAGDGPEEDRLRARCHAEELNVVFAGFRQRDELARIYAAADVFMFPTLGDPFGHVVEEAMSCELPVVSTSAAGEIRARIDDGRTGFIVPPANSRALVERMEALAKDGVLRRRIGRAGAARAAGHTADHWAQEFEEAIGAVLEFR